MIEEALRLQRIELAPGRAERIAAGLKATLEGVMKEPLPLEFEIDPASHALALVRCKA